MGAGPRGIALLEWMVVCTAICAVMLLLRYWSARVQRRKAYADDWMVLVAFASVVALDGVGIWAIYNGLGKHSNELSMEELGVMQKLIVAANVCWLVGTVFNKLSVLWLYRRIFKTRAFLKWTMGVIIVVVAFGVAFIIVFMTQCRPVSYIWNPVPGGGCRDLIYQEYASVSVNMAIDLAIFVLPLPVLWTLQMTTRNKFYVTIMLSFGLITIAVMAWRIQATYVTTHNPDFAYTLATIGLISGLELWLGIAVACMPTIAPLMQAYVRPAFQRLTSYYNNRRGGSGDKGYSSHEPAPSYNIQLKDHSRKTFDGPVVGASGLSNEGPSPRRGQPMPAGGPGGFGRALRSKRDDNPYVAIDDESRVLWTATNDGAWHTHVQDEGSGPTAGGIAVHRELNWHEEYRHGTAV